MGFNLMRAMIRFGLGLGKSLRRRGGHQQVPRRRGVCMELECLEDRVVLATYTVTTLADNNVGNPATNSGSLRWCMNQANGNAAAGNVINDQQQGVINLLTPLPKITKNLVINGPIWLVGTVRPNNANAFRVFQIGDAPGANPPTVDVTIRGFTIANGGGVAEGGGVYVGGHANLVLEGCSLQGNEASSGGGLFVGTTATALVHLDTFTGNTASNGGAIFSQGTMLTVSQSSIGFVNAAPNRATVEGGGINCLGPMTLTETFVVNNRAGGNGGGIYYGGVGGVPSNIIRSTISFNIATLGGGGVFNQSRLNILRSTIVANQAGWAGGNLFEAGGATTTVVSNTITNGSAVVASGGDYVSPGATDSFVNTIVAQNSAPAGPDVDGTVTSSGNNLIGDGSGATGFVASDQVGTSSNPLNPVLSSLGNYGGPTETEIPLPGSPALAAADPASAPPLDQRGFPGVVNGTADVGAVEVGSGADSQHATVGGLVWDDLNEDGIADPTEPGLQGILVQLLNGSSQAVASATTNSNGNYIFSGVDPGSYNLQVTAPAGFSFSPQDQGSDPTVWSDADPATGLIPITVAAGDYDSNFNAGLYNGGSPATANPDAYSTPHDQALAVSPADGVLANDSGQPGNPLTITAINFDPTEVGSTVVLPSGGTVNLAGDGSFVYTPPPGFVGQDGFVYTMTDGLTSSQTVVTIDVTDPTLTAQDDNYSTLHDQALTVSAAAGVLANDSTSLNATLTVSAVNGDPSAVGSPIVLASGATLQLNADGSLTYAPPASFVGEDDFDYTVTNGVTYTTALVTIDVTDPDLAANNDSYSTFENTPLNVTPGPGVLGNDSGDPSGTLTVAALNYDPNAVAQPTLLPSGATVQLNADGTFSYQPLTGFVGSDSFDYTMTDGYGLASAIVTIQVAPPPLLTVRDHLFATVLNIGGLSVDAADGVLAYDSASPSAPLTVTAVNGDSSEVGQTITLPSGASLQLNADGSFHYVPLAPFTGPDGFTCTVSDGVTSATATATVDVFPTFDPYLAPQPDSYTTAPNAPLAVSAGQGLLANDTGAPNAALSVVAVNLDPTAVGGTTDLPSGATVQVNSDGSFTYTPGAGFSGQDTFEYSVTDGSGVEREQVTVTVLGPTVLTLTDNGPNPSVVGDTVSLGGTVSPAVPDGETVYLEDASNGNAVVATASTAGGAFTFNVNTLGAGAHELFAAFAGDASYLPGQSGQVMQMVYAGPAPSVVSVVVNGDVAAMAGLHSVVLDVVFTFNEAVTISNGALDTAGGAISLAVDAFGGGTLPTGWALAAQNGPDSDSVWILTFSGTSGRTVSPIGGLLNGTYDITLNAANVSANGQGLAGSRADTTYVLFGDTNNDEVVNATDNRTFSRVFQGTLPYDPNLDYNGDGVVTNADNRAFARSYQSAGFIGFAYTI